MNDCIFCKIINREIPSEIVYEDDKVIAFKDVHPVAPVHVLTVPKQHIASANELNDGNLEIVKEIFGVIVKLASELGVNEDGYRIVNNCNDNGGQSVKHLHFHLIAGKKLNLTMG